MIFEQGRNIQGRNIMRKLLAITLALASVGFIGSWSEAKGNALTLTKTNPQIRIQIGRRNRDRDRNRRDYRERDLGLWNTTEVRIVHEGWRSYRETYQVRHFPDGRTQMILISRERIRDY
jgi:hypothetical protein